ncbi:MAG: cytochrome c nitrite reductase small subunit [Bacteroidetes bacterium 4572_112]|nr:MAG: cytochrome c nitrite reductase small subunit [Bacteroidetes bacterium 4572_112]
MKKTAISLFVFALLFFGYIVQQSQMTSYLSKDPKACINCHVMNTQYATWQHSSHGVAGVACIECHLPTDNFFEKYYAKSVDGWNHSVAFTNGTYDPAMKISDYGAERVQKNCISCHASMVSEIKSNSDKYHNYTDPEVETGRKCWDCHKSVPHGKVRSITTTPYNLGIKENK